MALPVTFTLVKFPLTKLPVTSSEESKYPKIYSDLFALFNTLRAMWLYLDENFQALEASIGDFVPEAPEDGTVYGRQDGAWVPISSGAVDWGDIGGTLADQTDLAAALATKEPTITAGTTAQYWRGDKSWQTLPSPGIADAPNDGSYYARRNLTWQSFTPGGGGSSNAPALLAPYIISTDSTGWSNYTLYVKLVGTYLLELANTWRFTLRARLPVAGNLFIGKINIIKTLTTSTSVISRTAVTIGGSASPTLSATTSFADWNTDAIALALTETNNFYVEIYFTSSSNPTLASGSGTVAMEAGSNAGDTTASSTVSYSSASAVIRGTYNFRGLS